MRRVRLVACALVALCGCGGITPTAPSGDPREEHVLAETVRFATTLHVRVSGVLTDDIFWTTASDGSGDKVPAAGWYEHGTAYYWRPHLLKQDLAYGTALAAHEVCHAISFQHDAAHANCVRGLLP